MKELFPKDGDSNLPDTSVQRIIHEQTELVSEVLYNVKEIEKLKKEVTAIRKERTHIQCQCRELMAKLDEHMKDDNAVSDKERSPSADRYVRMYVCLYKGHNKCSKNTPMMLFTPHNKIIIIYTFLLL